MCGLEKRKFYAREVEDNGIRNSTANGVETAYTVHVIYIFIKQVADLRK